MDPFVGQIFLLPYTFAPKNFAFCEGQLLPISQNTALFSLLGTTYGGDGKSTFALPDLRGRVPLGFGQGPGLTDYPLGASAGSENVTLLGSEIPQHVHTVSDISPLTGTVRARNAPGNQQTPLGNLPAIEAAGGPATFSNAAPNANMHASSVTGVSGGPTTSAGGDQPHSNMQPYLGLRFCIALAGVFPSHS
jgi:microcystin-dependent protein